VGSGNRSAMLVSYAISALAVVVSMSVGIILIVKG
jgi:hypothetical protein